MLTGLARSLGSIFNGFNLNFFTRKRAIDSDDDDDDDDDEASYQRPFKRNRFNYENLEADVQSGSCHSHRILEATKSLSYNSYSEMANKGVERIIPIISEASSDSQNKENASVIISNYFEQPTLDHFGKSSIGKLESGKHTEDLMCKKSMYSDFRFRPSLTSTVVKSHLGPFATKRRPLKISDSSRTKYQNISTVTNHGVPKHMKLLNKANITRRRLSNALSPLYSSPMMTPKESIRLDHLENYLRMLQQNTDVCVSSRRSIRNPWSITLDGSRTGGTGAIGKTRLDPITASVARRNLMEREKNPIKTNLGSYLSKGFELSADKKKTSRPMLIDFVSEDLPKIIDDDIIIEKEIIRPPPLKNLLEEKFQTSPYYDPDFINDLFKRHEEEKKKMLDDDVQHTREEQRKLEERRKQADEKLDARMMKDISQLSISYPMKYEILDKEKEVLPELTDEMMGKIKKAWGGGPPSQVLAEKFNIQITRRDLHTLYGLHWLNDEVINFYMNMLMERGTNDNYPSVYAFNTFFYSKLLKTGYASVKRWTKKVNVFSYDLLIIPVHLGMHWCLATIDFRKKTIKYYDSMLGDNNKCLAELQNYLESEHKDKKKSSFDVSAFISENVKDIPQQMNGSDCGMFSCKFAEYLSRDASITFTQEHMSYFRSRMVYEIITKTLM